MSQSDEARGARTHLLLGSDALQLVRDKLRTWSAEIARWKALTRSTDFA